MEEDDREGKLGEVSVVKVEEGGEFFFFFFLVESFKNRYFI